MCAKLLIEIQDEVTKLLSGLIKINTTNPPGNEVEAAKYLAREMERDGFECELFESAHGRGSVVTRLKGSGKKPGLVLLSHLDVVAANPKEWSVDPFGGVVKEGFVWGRGALDMKGMTAIEAMVLKLLKRNNVKLKGDVILAATADEEKGGDMGAGYLVQNHWDKVEATYVLNEGGGSEIQIDGQSMFTVNTAEKGIFWFKVKAKGRPGHGSVPTAADNAIMRMNKVIERLGNHRAKIVLIPTMRGYLSELAKTNKVAEKDLMMLVERPDKADEILDKLAQVDDYLAEEIRSRLRMTVAPTIVHGGVKENIIPSECETVFDCRVLPGQTPQQAFGEIQRLLSDVGLEKLEFETIQANEPSESPLNTPLYELIQSVLGEFAPDSNIAASLLTGGTDSRFFRKRGSVCYGFQPVRADIPYSVSQKTIHGIDERISVANLVFGTSILYEIVSRFMT
jgi:acetylornithine deacetylase/succinyl-diaminopimelate desuccinylase-like protein